MTVHGEETVASFEYVPAEQGKVKINQIKNTAIGDIYISRGPLVHGRIDEILRMNIEELFKDPGFVACINPRK